MDMSQVIIPKSDQLNADDLIAGPITIKITDVTIKSGQEQPIAISYEGDGGKPYKACKSMCRVMVTAWGADSKQYIGRSMMLFRDPGVTWGGMAVGGIRISHMSDIDSTITLALTMTRASKKPYTVKPITKAADTHPVKGTESQEDSLANASSAAPCITADEALKLEARCTENDIPTAKVRKAFAVERFSMMNGEQLAEAHTMIDSTLEQRKAAA